LAETIFHIERDHGINDGQTHGKKGAVQAISFGEIAMHLQNNL
jgi:hypothetical protein